MSARFAKGYADPQGKLIEVPGYGIVYAVGTTVPTDGTAGYAPGCEFQDLDGAAGAQVYINEGTLASCAFKALPSQANAVANPVNGVAGGYKIARGQLTTVTAADTVVTGLATVVSVVACLDSDPTDDPEWVSATIGDQAGSPAAGSVIIKTWKNTGGTDPTPVAATTFSKKVNWIAVGT